MSGQRRLATRAKGGKFEREVAAAIAGVGLEVRHLAKTGDRLVIGAGGIRRHVECKRHERLRLPEWIAQAERDTPAGVPWLLVFRQSRGEPYALERFVDRLELERRLVELEREVAELRRELGDGQAVTAGGAL